LRREKKKRKRLAGPVAGWTRHSRKENKGSKKEVVRFESLRRGFGDEETGSERRGKERLSDSANPSTSNVCGGRRKESENDRSKNARG
jgi:hypothetical protein